MEATEFLKTLRRRYDQKCATCPIGIGIRLEQIDDSSYICEEWMLDNPSEFVEMIEQWAKDNPVKTYWDVFKERNPELSDIKIKELYCRNIFFKPLKTDCPYFSVAIKERAKTNLNDLCSVCDLWDREYKKEEQQ